MITGHVLFVCVCSCVLVLFYLKTSSKNIVLLWCLLNVHRVNIHVIVAAGVDAPGV